jgi:superfamily I DNA and/or RNA helicase
MNNQNDQKEILEKLNNYSFVEGHSYLVRDEKTNAILNTNYDEYKNYIEMKKLKEKESKRIEYIEDSLDNLKNDLSEIKNLLKKILQ